MSKALFLWLGILSHMGDRMWFFGAYLLLAKAFPSYQMTLASIYGLSIAGTAAIFSSTVGVWIDRTPRLRAATILIIIQNLSVALAAGIQILGMQSVASSSSSSIVDYVMIGSITLLGCCSMLASIGVSIVIERDWIPEIFQSQNLTSVNAWIRRIDQCAMLIGPAVAGFIINFSPELGGGWISLWNILSLFIEIFLIRKIYSKNFEILERKPKNPEKNEIEKSEIISKIKKWTNSWYAWYSSPVFVPGIALALLYTNVFQLSYVAQAYISTHCISDAIMAIVWVCSGAFGLLGTSLYEIVVNRIGLVFAAVIGAIFHSICVIGTIVGLFLEGSPYVLANESYNVTNECSNLEFYTPIELDNHNFTNLKRFALDGSVECHLPQWSLVSISTLIGFVAFSRCGLWLFDLAVNQMFQEWIPKHQRGTVSGTQSGIQSICDMIHFGIVFLFPAQCEFGHAIILTAGLMGFGYILFFIHAAMGEIKCDSESTRKSDSDYVSGTPLSMEHVQLAPGTSGRTESIHSMQNNVL